MQRTVEKCVTAMFPSGLLETSGICSDVAGDWKVQAT